jgi:hypothetical protein
MRRRKFVLAALTALTARAPARAQGRSERFYVLGPEDPGRLVLEFNTNRSKVRLLLMFSPTCARCLRGASDMQLLLKQHNDPDLVGYFVWGPYLRNDTEQGARDAAQRFTAPGSTHFWTPAQKLGRDLGAVLHMPAGAPAWDVFLMYARGVMWTSGFPEPTYWQQDHDYLQGAPFDINLLGGRVIQALGARR